MGRVAQLRANPRPHPWLVVGLLLAFMAINFADKAVFGLAALPIMGDLRLSHLQFGSLGGAFFALFSLSALIVSALGDRLPQRWLIAGMAIVWTLAQAPLAATVGIGTLLASRVLLGAGEGPALPVALHAAYVGLPDRRRPLVAALIQSGIPIGIAAAALGLTAVIARFGWHAAYATLAAASGAWCLAWLTLTKSTNGVASQPARISSERSSLRRLLLNRTMLGIAVLTFAAYWSATLSLVWLPAFLQLAGGFTVTQAGEILTGAWILQIPAYLFVVWVSNALQRRGYPSEISRGAPGALGAAITGAGLVVLAATHAQFALIALVPVVVASAVVIGVTGPPMIAEIAPPSQLGTALGAIVAVYALAGIVAPPIVGKIIDTAAMAQAGYRLAFLGSGLFVVVAAVAAAVLMRPSSDRYAASQGFAK